MTGHPRCGAKLRAASCNAEVYSAGSRMHLPSTVHPLLDKQSGNLLPGHLQQSRRASMSILL